MPNSCYGLISALKMQSCLVTAKNFPRKDVAPDFQTGLFVLFSQANTAEMLKSALPGFENVGDSHKADQIFYLAGFEPFSFVL